MDQDKRELERKRERLRDLLREYPDGPINGMLRDYIADLEQQLRDLEQ